MDGLENLNRYERLVELGRQGWDIRSNPQTGMMEAVAPPALQAKMKKEAQEQLRSQLSKKMIPSPEAEFARQKILGNPKAEAQIMQQMQNSTGQTNTEMFRTPTVNTGLAKEVYEGLKKAISENPNYLDFKGLELKNLEGAQRDAELFSKIQQVGRGVPLNSLMATHNALFPKSQFKMKGPDAPEDVAATEAALKLKLAGQANDATKQNLYYQAALAGLNAGKGYDQKVKEDSNKSQSTVKIELGTPSATSQKPDTTSDSFNTEFRKSVLKSTQAAEAAAKDITSLEKVIRDGDIGTIKRQIGEFATMNGESAARFSDADAKRYIPSSVLSQLAGFEKYLTGTGSIKGTAEQKMMIRSLLDGARKWKETFPNALDTFRTVYKEDRRWNPGNENILKNVEPQILKQFPKTEYDKNDIESVKAQAKEKSKGTVILTDEQAARWIEENYGRTRKK